MQKTVEKVKQEDKPYKLLQGGRNLEKALSREILSHQPFQWFGVEDKNNK